MKLHAGDYECDRESGMLVPRSVRRGLERRHPQFMSGPAFFGGGDPYFNGNSLLLHCNGANLSTSFIDNSPRPKSVTAFGSAKVDTSQSQFGGASALFTTSGSFLKFPQHTDFDFGTGALTIEFFLFSITGNVASNRVIQSRDGDLFAGIYLSYSTATQLQFYYSTTGSSFAGSGFTFSITNSAWNYVTITRNAASGVFTIRVNGVSQGTCGTTGSIYYNASDSWVVGGQTTPNRTMQGNIDEMRITKGVERYIADFTPPVAAFPDS